MAFVVEFTAFGTPVPKGRPRFSGRGGFIRTYTPEKTRVWEDVVAQSAREAMGSSPPVEWPVAMSIRVSLPIPKSWSKTKQAQAEQGDILPINKQDLDNHAKSVMDACLDILYLDDGQVIDLHVNKRYSKYPCVEVTMIEVVQ